MSVTASGDEHAHERGCIYWARCQWDVTVETADLWRPARLCRTARMWWRQQANGRGALVLLHDANNAGVCGQPVEKFQCFLRPWKGALYLLCWKGIVFLESVLSGRGDRSASGWAAALSHECKLCFNAAH